MTDSTRTDDNQDRPTSVDAVIAARRAERAAAAERRADAQARADKRRPTFGGSTT